MNDIIIKGTGNSRTLKTVADFLTRYPTYADFAAGFIAGEIPADIGPLVAAGVQQQGTALNKANLLSDTTGTKLGLASTATPNDALSTLASRYGTCSTAAATKAKVVTLSGFTLVTGAIIAVKFTYGNTAASPTLNVNGTGAKSIAVYGTTAAGSGAWSAGEVVLFVYDGTRWVMNSGAILGTGSNCEIYTGSYVGDGAISFSLTFPKPINFFASNSNTIVELAGWGIPVDGEEHYIVSVSGSKICYEKLNNNVLTFRSLSEYFFLNQNGSKYNYIALAI